MKFINSRGFSLIELMVTLVVASIVIGAVYLTTASQERSMKIEDRLSEVQENIRAGFYLLSKDLRTAGYNPECISPPCNGFIVVSNSSVTFKRNNFTTNLQEKLSYYLYDSGGDGDLDLGRQLTTVSGVSPIQPVVENTDAINFVYFDGAGNRLFPPLSATDLSNIKVVEITIVVHSEVSDPDYSAAGKSFKNLQGETIFTAPSDHLRRRMIRSRIFCRNNT